MSKLQLFHTSPETSIKINDDGLFGTGLFFCLDKVYSMGGDHVHRLVLDESNIIKVWDLPFLAKANQEFFEQFASILQEIGELFGIDPDDYECMEYLSDEKNEWDSDLPMEDKGEAGWQLQRLQLEAAKTLGYAGVELEDEQGTSYLIDMKGREDQLEYFKVI